MNNFLVNVEWLNTHLKEPNMVVLDASQPSSPSEPISIPGARVFDLKNTFSDTSSEYPNTFPLVEQFERESRRLGINKKSKVVVYDNRGIYFSPRVWWMFKVMGHENVAVLDGGLPEWEQQGFKTETRKTIKYAIGDFTASLQPNVLKNFDFVLKNIDQEESLVVDARSAGRFNGTAPEPRKGLRSGSIPKSMNIPYETLLENGKFKNKEGLLEIFGKKELGDQPLVFSCGSGVTACIVLLATELAGLNNEKGVFDGSWTEWAQRTDS
ncbi:sulfurtransferase [Maribacter sp. HTCC2170]|uniref:sulfurtransferase n=1 Tax=Maribacter sp. (strain HTCC2170 / KCCM 42371) TaxID=313603 RepID=UPI00006BD229|nr:sulfurtransferase [Maribacter sp. HTCC2170]EAR02968.1 thiosulfate sulfurtransferase SseA, putative [Maribacter sp. HTCC2170]